MATGGDERAGAPANAAPSGSRSAARQAAPRVRTRPGWASPVTPHASAMCRSTRLLHRRHDAVGLGDGDEHAEGGLRGRRPRARRRCARRAPRMRAPSGGRSARAACCTCSITATVLTGSPTRRRPRRTARSTTARDSRGSSSASVPSPTTRATTATSARKSAVSGGMARGRKGRRTTLGPARGPAAPARPRARPRHAAVERLDVLAEHALDRERVARRGDRGAHHGDPGRAVGLVEREHLAGDDLDEGRRGRARRGRPRRQSRSRRRCPSR